MPPLQHMHEQWIKWLTCCNKHIYKASKVCQQCYIYSALWVKKWNIVCKNVTMKATGIAYWNTAKPPNNGHYWDKLPCPLFGGVLYIKVYTILQLHLLRSGMQFKHDYYSVVWELSRIEMYTMNLSSSIISQKGPSLQLLGSVLVLHPVHYWR